MTITETSDGEFGNQSVNWKFNKKIMSYLFDPLYKNSLYLALTRVFNAACGFIFWVLATRLYPIEAVGIATALVSSLGIIDGVSRLGADFSLIRYMPIRDKSKVMSSCLIITLIASVIIGIIYIAAIKLISPSLSFVRDTKYLLLFITFVIFNSISSTTGNSFIAIREAKLYFYQNILLALRLILLFPFIIYESFGIFAAMGLATISSAVYSFHRIVKKIRFELKLDKQFIKESFNFSFGNHVSDLLVVVPTLVLPIMILNMVGEAETARFSIAYSIGSIVLIIPDSLSHSLFVEGSHGEDLKENLFKALSIICILLIPAVAFIYFFGDYLLEIFGKNYIEAFELLRLIAISSFFVTIHSLFIPIQNIRMQIRSIVLLNFIRAILLLGSSYILIKEYGVIGVGYAWLITYILISIGIICFAKKVKWI